MKTVRSAVVGVGYLGRFHAQKHKALSERTEQDYRVDFLGVMDSDPERAKQVAKELGVSAFGSIEELVASGCQAVTVAASTRAHFPIASQLIAAGIHINVEKPMTATLEEGQALVRLAEEKSVVLQVGHVERFNPALRSARKKLLKPLFIECHRLAPFKPRGVDVDVIFDLMIHDLDVILSLVDAEVDSVSAVGTPVLTSLVDIANARIEFTNGTVANVTSSRVSQSSTRKFRVFQEKQYLSIDFGAGDVHLTTRTQGDWPVDLESIQNPSDLPLEFEHWSLEKGDALLDETDSFFKACTGIEPVAVSGRDGLRAMELATRIQQAVHQRLSVSRR